MCNTCAHEVTDYPIGTLAYLDSFSGLVRCRVVDLDGNTVKVEITARNNRVYAPGEVFWQDARQVVPRDRVRNGINGWRIRNGWRYVATPEGCQLCRRVGHPTSEPCLA